MDVSELIHFVHWSNTNVQNTQTAVNTLYGVFNHNATQAQKQPVEPPFDALKKVLNETHLEELTAEQVELLKNYDIYQYLGELGLHWLSEITSLSGFDPVTATEQLRDANARLTAALQETKKISTAFDDTKIREQVETPIPEIPTVRVRFKENAAIENIVQWKSWANDWHLIARGVANAAGEAPENVRVVGASNGSIVITLASTAIVTALLARIVKHISGMFLEVLQVRAAIEDLKQKKYLTEKIKIELEKQAADVFKEGEAKILEDVRSNVGGSLTKEAESSLSKSISRLLDFFEKGGDVDFVEPEADDEEPVEDENGTTPLQELREQIDLIRADRENIRLLENKAQSD